MDAERAKSYEYAIRRSELAELEEILLSRIKFIDRDLRRISDDKRLQKAELEGERKGVRNFLMVVQVRLIRYREPNSMRSVDDGIF